MSTVGYTMPFSYGIGDKSTWFTTNMQSEGICSVKSFLWIDAVVGQSLVELPKVSQGSSLRHTKVKLH